MRTRKLKLDPDRLVVDTFEPVPGEDGNRGTVKAHESVGLDYCDTYEGCYPQTGDPRLRICYTPYYVCDTRGWTCLLC